MKKIFLILTLLVSIKIFGQKEEIYRLTFNDKSNFTLTTLINHTFPKNFLIIDTTSAWNPNRFWLQSFDNRNKAEVIKRIKDDEHDPYFHTYLFSDTALNMLFSDKEKQRLFKKSKDFKSKHIDLIGSNYKTIESSKNIDGFYFITSEPLFSDNKEFAFIDIDVFFKESYAQDFNETWFGTICIVFQKTGKSWKRIAKKDWLIL